MTATPPAFDGGVFHTVGISCDHAGVKFKEHIIGHPLLKEYTWVDYGTDKEQGNVDYPHYAKLVANALSRQEIDGGLCLCGTGIGMSMVANRYPEVRAACVWNLKTAQASRQHNDANILCLGSRVIDIAKVPLIVKTWLSTPFQGGRHQKRIDQFSHQYTTHPSPLDPDHPSSDYP